MSTSSFLLENYEGLGTIWFIELFEFVQDNKKEKLIEDTKSIITDFNLKYSRFKPDSLLNILNSEGKVHYDENLYYMLKLGEELFEKTDGVFDLFIKADLESRGYGNTLLEIIREKKNEIDKRFSCENGYIYLHTEKQIDLGGIGKGYLIDLLAKFLKSQGLNYFLINGGGDIFCTADNLSPVDIYLSDPKSRENILGSVSLLNQSFCASSSYVRRWQKEGVNVNHFIDTKEKKNIEAASFVVGDNATLADVFATVVCIENNFESLKKWGDELGLHFLKIRGDGFVEETLGFRQLRKEVY